MDDWHWRCEPVVVVTMSSVKGSRRKKSGAKALFFTAGPMKGALGGGSLELVFFQSRRRHTRSDRDWSSDVCSSDLVAISLLNPRGPLALLILQRLLQGHGHTGRRRARLQPAHPVIDLARCPLAAEQVAVQVLDQIGRASCRERV